MSYRFKLEALRKYRNFQEDILQKELAQAQRERDQEIEMLQSLIDRRMRVEENLKLEQENSTSGPHMALYDTYLQRVTGDIAEQRLRIDEAESLCKTKMKALLEAMQHRKSIDKLKEKDLQAYLDNQNQNEQKFLNEIAINRFTRNNR